MKKTVYFAAAAVIALTLTSCFGKQESSYTQQYIVSFEPNDPYSGIGSIPFSDDSVYVSSTGYNFFSLVTLNAKGSGDELYGGWAISQCKDPVAAEGHSPKNNFAVFGSDGGSGGSNTFGVYYDNPVASQVPEYGVAIFATGSTEVTNNVLYVNNTNAVVNSILYGDDKFSTGDYFLLTISGYTGTAKVGEVEVYLADYRSSVPKVIQEWTEVKLSSIASATSLKFSLTSTKEGTPRYFCMDNYVGQVVVTY